MKRGLVALLGPLVLTALAYVNAVGNDFAFDDEFVLVENRAVRDLSNLPEFFTDPATGSSNLQQHVFYRPLRTTVYGLVYRVFGLDPQAFHAINLLLHLSNVVLVFLVVLNLGDRVTLAALVSAVFGVHPIMTEAVSSITGLTDVLFAFFYLLAFYLHLARVRRGSGFLLGPAAVAVAFCLSLLSKEMAITFPLAVLLTDVILRRDRARPIPPLPYASYLSTLFVLAIGFLVLRTQLLATVGQNAEFPGGTLWRTMLMQGNVVLEYIRLIFLPVGQSVRHSISIPPSYTDPGSLVSLVVLCIGIGLGVAALRRNRNVSWGIAWFVVTLLPVMNLIPIRGAMMGERFLYVPMIGIVYALGHPLVQLVGRCSSVWRRVVTVVASILITLLASLTVVRNRDWKNTITILESAVRVAPDSNAVRYNLVREYRRSGNTTEARRHYLDSVDNTQIHLQRFAELGDRTFEDGRLGEARIWYRRVLALDAEHPHARERLRQIDRSLAR